MDQASSTYSETRGRLTSLRLSVHSKSMTLSYFRRQGRNAYYPKGHHLFDAPEMAEQVQQVLKEESRSMSEFLRDAIRLYMDEREWQRKRRQRAEARDSELGASREGTLMSNRHDFTPVALYARVSSDRQDVTCPWPRSCGRSGTMRTRTATSSSASTWTRPRADASPTAPSSAR